MSFLLTKISLSSPQLVRFSPVQISSVRNKTRAKKYGSEEGFDVKNEVRKEKWIRKNSPNRTCGGEYRSRLGLGRNVNRHGPLYDIPDWKYADGTPGIPWWVHS